MDARVIQKIIEVLKKPVMMFLLGILLSSIVFSIATSASVQETNQNNILTGLVNGDEFQYPLSGGRDIASPKDYLTEDQISVFSDKVVIDVQNVKWAGFMDTKSMLPVINKDSNALQIEPNCPEDIILGDIVSYKSEYASGIIIHRVVYIGNDEKGTYFILKGDNNPASDPGKIRCEQIQRKVIGILY